MSMNPEVKAEWIAALRSDEYTQLAGALRRENEEGKHSHCCLGVLCELSARSGKGHWYPNTVSMFEYGGKIEPGCVPGPLAIEYGMSDQEYPGNPKVCRIDALTQDEQSLFNEDKWPDRGAMVSLAELNDVGIPFSRIADIIEKYL